MTRPGSVQGCSVTPAFGAPPLFTDPDAPGTIILVLMLRFAALLTKSVFGAK